MWKKLFYGASKKVADDVSRAVGNDMRRTMKQNKEQHLADQYRKDTIAEHEKDVEFQQDLKVSNERLQFLVESNNVANKALKFLTSPFDQVSIVDEIIRDLEELSPTASQFLEEMPFQPEYTQQIILNTITPLVNINKIMFGSDEEDDNGIFGYFSLIVENGNQDMESLEELLSEAITLIFGLKENILETFQEIKGSQVVKYFAYGTEDEIDFGIYTIDDLEDYDGE